MIFSLKFSHCNHYHKTQCVHFYTSRINIKTFSSLISNYNLPQKKMFLVSFSTSLLKFRFYSKAVIVVKQYTVFEKLMRRLFRILFIYILYVRSFFIKDRTYIFVTVVVPVVTAVFIYLTNTYPQTFSGFSACYFFTFIGLQLITYDALGSRISAHILTDPDPILSMTMLIALTNKKNVIVRHFGSTTITNLFMGKTAMTATGRASLIAGVFTGGAWLYNSARDRQAANNRATADRQAADNRATADRQAENDRATANRQAADIRAQADRQAIAESYARQRAYQNYQDANKEYLTQPFYKQKGDKPCWDEANWSNWSKTK